MRKRRKDGRTDNRRMENIIGLILLMVCMFSTLAHSNWRCGVDEITDHVVPYQTVAKR